MAGATHFNIILYIYEHYYTFELTDHIHKTPPTSEQHPKTHAETCVHSFPQNLRFWFPFLLSLTVSFQIVGNDISRPAGPPKPHFNCYKYLLLRCTWCAWGAWGCPPSRRKHRDLYLHPIGKLAYRTGPSRPPADLPVLFPDHNPEVSAETLYVILVDDHRRVRVIPF